MREIDLIRLGRMGRNLAANMIARGIAVCAWDPSEGSRAQARAVMLAVPAGDAVEDCLVALSGLLAPGDVVIDSGNSHYRDTERRQSGLAKTGIDLVGLAVSGGPKGARLGPSLMAGGLVVS